MSNNQLNQVINHSGTAVTFEDVTVAFGEVPVLDRICAVVPRGSNTAIIGPNGAGKTTLLLALLGQQAFTGQICFPATGSTRPRIGYVPQKLSFDSGMPLTVREFMALGMQRLPLWIGVRRRARERGCELLAAVGAQKLQTRRLGALSGGELQRVLLALALEQEPELLVLDEPAAGVDYSGEQVFCELLEGLRRKFGFTQLMVSHDLPTVTHHATHVICLNRRLVAQGAPDQVLTGENLTELFGLHMGLVASRGLPRGRTTCTASCCCGKENHDA